jgi:uncharacterized membrane protein (DUF4010 family)
MLRVFLWLGILTLPMDYTDLTTLGIAFGLGLLVGMQREATRNKIAGVRTFTLISVLGAMGGLLSRDYNNILILPLLAIAITALLVAANYMKIKKLANPDLGQTTEVAALLMFAVGAYLVMGNQVIGIIMGGGIAVLLFIKERLHGMIARLEGKDLDAIMTFAAISMVVLPILPDKAYDALQVLNPYNIWLMVVLIVGISVAGYFIYKFAGHRAGIISNGVLGGVISSTATAVSFARKTRENKALCGMAAFVITTASAISLARVVLEAGVVIPDKLPLIILPLLVQFILMAILCAGMFYFIDKQSPGQAMSEHGNPAQFKSALIFGLLYGIILLAVAFAKKEFGNNALYPVAIVSGLTDMDAITLSLSQLMKTAQLKTDTGWRLILLASVSNLIFKGVLAGILGGRRLLSWLAVSFGISVVAGLLLIWLWPENWHI